MYYLRSRPRNIILLLLLIIVVVTSIYKLDKYLTIHREGKEERLRKKVNLQRPPQTYLRDEPCHCNDYCTDVSTDPTIFQSTVLPYEDCCLPSVGNGYVATVVYSNTIYLNGLYNGYHGNSRRARVPSTTAIKFIVPKRVAVTKETFTLNVKQGVFVRHVESDDIIIEQKIYAHQYLSRLLINDITIVRNTSVNSTREIVLRLTNRTVTPSKDIRLHMGSSGRKYVEYMFGNTTEAETDTSGTLPVHIYWSSMPSSLTLTSLQTSHTWTFITSISNCSEEAASYFDRGIKALKDGTLFNKHRDMWLYKWSQGSIDVDQDLYLAKAIYGSMYYILSSLPPLEKQSKDGNSFNFYGISPGSLAHGGKTGSYGGHVFWDQETWMYPSIMIFHPELATRILESRTMHLDAAANIARSRGYRGIEFPWEMAYSGYEVCPAPPYSTNEVHVNGDIALAFQQYLYLTNDTLFLIDQKGWQVITGLAEYWASKAEYDTKTGSYSIRNVMGPDEYHKNVSNSVYTNSIAQISLRLASYAGKLIGKPVSSDWEKIADNLVILFDKKLNYHPEFEGYQIGTRIKQADVILLGYPLMVNMSKTVRENDLLFYDTYMGYHVTDLNGPAMTWGMFAIGWLELGNISKAADVFKRSYANIQQPFKIWTEESSGFGVTNFITGMGEFLQTIIYGHGGFRIKQNSLEFNFMLPSSSSQLNFTGISYLGSELDFKVTETSVLINRTFSLKKQMMLEAVVAKKVLPLEIGKAVTISRTPGCIRRRTITKFPQKVTRRGKHQSRKGNSLTGPKTKLLKALNHDSILKTLYNDTTAKHIKIIMNSQV